MCMKSLRHPLTRSILWYLFLISMVGFSALAAFPASPQGSATIGPIQLSSQPEIDAGFKLLYELKFSDAHAAFAGWESKHPGEPLGPAAEAAQVLFQEFDRQGVLTSDFFLDDDRLLGGVPGLPRSGRPTRAS